MKKQKIYVQEIHRRHQNGLCNILLCLESTRTIEPKTPPTVANSIAYFPKISLEEVQSKSDAGIIEIPKQTVIPTERTIAFSEAGIILLPKHIPDQRTIRIKVIVKTKNNNYNNET